MSGSHGCRAYLRQRSFRRLSFLFHCVSGLWDRKVSSGRRDFPGGLPTLRCIEVNCLGIGLSRGGGAMGHIYVDSERPHNIHADKAWRRLQAHYDNKTGSPATLTPLQVEMLGLSSNLERFTVCTVHRPLKLLQGPHWAR